MPDDYYSITRDPGVRPDGTVHVRLAGTLDIGARPDLHGALAAVAGEPGVTAVRVDLSGVTFLDSEALAGLIQGFEEARRAGLDFAVAGAQGLVHRVLAVTGTLALFTATVPAPEPAQALHPGR